MLLSSRFQKKDIHPGNYVVASGILSVPDDAVLSGPHIAVKERGDPSAPKVIYADGGRSGFGKAECYAGAGIERIWATAFQAGHCRDLGIRVRIGSVR
jgi:hypothetical protein